MINYFAIISIDFAVALFMSTIQLLTCSSFFFCIYSVHILYYVLFCLYHMELSIVCLSHTVVNTI